MTAQVDVEKLWARCYGLLSPHIREFRLNQAFYSNQQNVEFDTITHETRLRVVDDRRPFYKTNLIRSRVNRLVGKIVQQRLEFWCVPSNGDDLSRGRALNSQKLLQWRSVEGGWNSIRAENALAFILGGTSIISVEPDPDGVEKLFVYTVDEACLEPGVRSADQARWWMTCTLVPAEVLQDIYGLPSKPSGGAVRPLQQNRGLRGGQTQNLVPLYKYFERPNRLRPEGLIVHSTGSQVLFESPWLFSKERLNAFVFRQTPVPGSWLGDSCVSEARNVQVQYNELRRDVLEHLAVFNTKLLIPEGSLSDETALTDDSRQPIYFMPGLGEPRYLAMPPLSRTAYEQPHLLIQEIDEQLYTHEASRGISPGDRYSGTAIAALNEYNDSPLIVMLREERDQWAEIASFVLGMYADQPASVSWKAVMDQHGIQTAEQWTPMLLDPNVRVAVRAESDVPQSPVVIQARLAELLAQFPRLADAIDPDRLLKLLNIPGADSITSKGSMDAKLAQWENVQIGTGQVILPRSWEDHAIHIAEHNWMRNAPEFRSWPQEVQEIMNDHVEAHEQYLRAETFEQILLNDARPGLAAMPQAHRPVGSAVPEPEGGGVNG